MDVILPGRIAQKLEEELKEFHVGAQKEYEGRRGYKFHATQIDLAKLTKQEVLRLMKILETSGIYGGKLIASDIRKYLNAEKEGIGTMKARTVRQAAWMLEFFIARLEHHIIFSTDRYGGDSHSGFYVNDVEYEPEKIGDRSEKNKPAYTILHVIWIENDNRRQGSICLTDADCLEMTAQEILHKAGYVPETPALMANLKKETERFYHVKETIGKQYVGKGIALDDLDNAEKHSGSSQSFTWGGSNKIDLNRFGSQTKVVIDIYQETEKSGGREDKEVAVNLYRWHEINMRFFSPSEDDAVRFMEADEDTEERPKTQVPVHPLVPVYDLRRHKRLRIHINNLTEYVYKKEVAKNLVLPERDWRMVNLLVDQSQNTFQDIVEGKGQSMNVLCEGPPGTGKTATAEVFSEFKERPLYIVQCSQLGLTPDEVENNLQVILTRANRWNAVLLLDEADVYIRKRKDDIHQNAIVGAFLRVLEYASCILFMTTNLANDVDDAVASRCIARLRYHAPGEDLQVQIWQTLARLNNIVIPEAEFRKVAKRHPNLTGRDVKNLLKLASFVAQTEKKALTADSIEFALQFKPTETTET